MDINKEIQVATDKFVAEKLPEMVTEKVGKMVDSILEDIFRSYSDTAKSIKSKIEEKLDINLQKFDLVDYNHLVSKAISDQLVGIVNENAIQPILELTKDAIGFVKQKEIKLSQIHEMVLEEAKEECYDTSGHISFHVEENENNKWHTISFDIEKDQKEKECGVSFLVNESGSIFCFRSGNFLQRKAEVTPARLTMLSSLEHKIFRLYSAGVKVIIDEYDFDNYWQKYND